MITKIKHFFGFGKSKKPTTDFSAFFRSASSEEKKKVLIDVVRKANKDQRDLVERYDTIKPVCR